MGLLIAPGIPDGDKKSLSHTFASGKPPGLIEDANRAEMLPLQIVSTRLQESTATGGSANYWWAQHPEVMGTRLYRATATVANQSVGTDRGACVWVGGNDGVGGDAITNLVFMRVRSQSNAVIIGTKMGLGAGIAVRTTAANGVVVQGDEISLEISESGGVYTYTGFKNGVPLSGATWPDTGAAFGVPGKAWGCGGYGLYSGGYFPSLGCWAMACADL